MKAQPGIFITNEILRDAVHFPNGNGAILKNCMETLLRSGFLVAVGESSIEKVLETTQEFSVWFDQTTSSGAAAMDCPPLQTGTQSSETGPNDGAVNLPISWEGELDSPELDIILVQNFILHENSIRFKVTTCGYGANQKLSLETEIPFDGRIEPPYSSLHTRPKQMQAANTICYPVEIAITSMNRAMDSLSIEGTWTVLPQRDVFSFSGTLYPFRARAA
jgi:hypothetical protein